MSDEELISAYVDGRMSEPERATFEARLQADAALRRQVAVTRLLVDQSRQVEVVLAPKNFILPQDFGKATQPASPAKRFDWRLLFFRFGSVAAAMVFVFAVAFDALRSTPPATPNAAPMAAQAEITTVPEAAITTNIEPVTATVAPEQAAGAPMMQSRAMQTDVRPSIEQTVTIMPAAMMTESLPSAASAKSVPAPQAEMQSYAAATMQAPATMSLEQPAPLVTPARIIAALALLFAIALGIAGWRR